MEYQSRIMNNIEKCFKEANQLPKLSFDELKDKKSQFKDLHALILLEKLAPFNGSSKMISGLNDYDVFITCDYEKLNKVITVEIASEFIACGLFYDSAFESLYFMV